MRKMGFSEDDMEFFHVHIEGDTEHAHVGLELTDRYAVSAELQARALAAVHGSAELRYSMLDGIYHRVVQKNAA
jgi:pyrroloquinoline quinone (PQQ) biosynthesis protein C